MSIQQIIAGGGGLLVVILTIVQISPIKIDPWSALAKAVGKAINGEVLQMVGALEDKVDTLESEVQASRAESAEQVAVNCRARILRFGDEVLHGGQHTKDHFDQVLRDITSYEHYCDEHPEFENNVTELTSARIKEIYLRCLSDNDFL